MVVGAGDDPGLGEYERVLMSIKTTARKELILLHPERNVVPGSTREWLKVFLALLHDSLYSTMSRSDHGLVGITTSNFRFVTALRK